MNCVPIADRELRVAARKRSTFWLRVAAALTGILIGGGCLIITALQGARLSQVGSGLFGVLCWMSFAAAISSGLFLTSDSLSEEKREGTLGLLFLTDLRGHDVVLGKLFATSLRGFYALLAVMPVMAITLLMGGVTGAEYWKSCLALVNALVFSLAAGMLVSSVSRDSQKALVSTLLLLLLLNLGGPLVDALIADITKRGFRPVVSLASPGYVMVAASAWGRSAYWTALFVSQAVAWALFASASVLIPHSWQDKKRGSPATSSGWAYDWKYGSKRRRRRLRRLLDVRPMVWLGCRERWQSFWLWSMAVLASGGFLALIIAEASSQGWIIWAYLGGLFTLFLYVWAASQACRFLAHARRSGLIELILVSPITERQLVGGHGRAMLRLFGWPVLILLGVHVTATTLSQLSIQRMATQVSAMTAAGITNQTVAVTNTSVVGSATVSVSFSGTNASNLPAAIQLPNERNQIAMAAGAAFAAALCTAANLAAICWFGMWMGMVSRSPNLATLKTLLFVQVLPWLVISFCSAVVAAMTMAIAASRGGGPDPAVWLAWWPLLSACLGTAMAIGKDLGFIFWSRAKLYKALREEAGRSLGYAPTPGRVPLSRPASPPPIPAPASQ